MLKKAAVLAVSCGAFLAGCGGTQADIEIAEITSNLVQAGYPAADIMVVDDMVYVQNDAHVTLEASREMLQSAGSEEQYRTTNLVSSSVTKICVNPTSQFSKYPKLMTGLDMAIENYNQQNLSFVMVRGPATGCSANITAKTAGGTGGSAGFPSGGMPYGEINIGMGLNNYSQDVSEHVITHELGHCVGFRHSDYYNRAISCGSGGNEGASTVGAIHIAGTPTTAVMNGSVMNACFHSGSTGEWTSSDITALNALY